MSLLTPLYVLALAAISLPLLLHLIRRTPRGRQSFSSLMFLAPSPPRLTRRSRLDNLLLLLLRGLALALLALAFARPFFREAASLSLEGVRGRRVAIVLDTSASMQRPNVWTQAREEVGRVLDGLETSDDVALFTFDDQVRAVVDFEDATRIEPQAKAAAVRQALRSLAPGWGGTDLALALTTTADALSVASDVAQVDEALQIVLISDLQSSAGIQLLEAYQWPAQVSLAARRIVPQNNGNAALRILADAEESITSEFLRVRVANSGDSGSDQFYLRWGEATAGAGQEDEVAVYVPPGQSRVVRVPHPQGLPRADRLILRGDDCPFDNVFYTVPLRQQQVTVFYIGSETADDAEGLHYYLQLAFSETPRRKVTIVPRRGDQPLEAGDDQRPDLIVVAEAVAAPQLEELKGYVRQGGSLFVIAHGEQAAVQLVSFDQSVRLVEDTADRQSDYVMLSEIDFTHPLFAAFAKPQYSDFTKIHFWNHTRFAIDEGSAARIVARFDDGSPALWDQPYGEGRVFVLTSSWRPEESQLALSTKFVPLITGVLEQAAGGNPTLPSYTVNQPVTLPEEGEVQAVEKPDGTRLLLSAGTRQFAAADQPGIYRAQMENLQLAFAVNLPAAESETAALDLQRLEQFGVPLGDQPTRSQQIEQQRQLRDVELEGRQKIWRWLIVMALCVLSLETWLAGRLGRRINKQQ